MPKNIIAPSCDCCDAFSRRDFLKTAAVATVLLPFGSVVEAADKLKKPAPAETLVTELYKSLNDQQRGEICFPFGHELQSKIDNAWHITKSKIEGMNPQQQELIREIFVGLHSEEYAKPVLEAVEHDNGEKGFGDCSIALFGEPGMGKFQFVFTGRHVTRRCDGDSIAGTAFGGPIFMGIRRGTRMRSRRTIPGTHIGSRRRGRMNFLLRWMGNSGRQP